MNEVEFTRKHLGEYVRRGEELKVKVCPFCHGNKGKFFINTEKHTFICHRGSCGARGTFNELAKMFNEKAGYIMDIERNKFENNIKKKVYKAPQMKLNGLEGQAVKYIQQRGITEKTMKQFGLKTDEKGNIVFPYYDEKNVHRLNKIRIPRKFNKDKDKTKIWQEGDGKPILFGMNKVNTDKPLVITEGEWDCMIVFECGFYNVVSVPFGTGNLEWINECWDFLNEFEEIILFFDNDDAGKTSASTVSRKLGLYRVRIVENTTKFKDANEIFFNLGASKVIELIDNAKFVPVDEINVLADVKKKKRDRILYGNQFLDYNFGGCGMGELVIWSGKRGGGKSTVLNQTLASTVDQKEKVFLYSGELNNYKVKQWLDRQIAGSRYIITEEDELTHREEYIVDPKVESLINDWYRDYIFVYSDDASDEEDCLFEVMEYAYKRHNVRRFVLDNMKTIKFNNSSDFYRSQGLFVKRAKAFAQMYEVHIDLVVHPRKSAGAGVRDEDVGGSSDIIDLADNVVFVERIKEENIDSCTDEKLKERMKDNQTMLNIKKNREYGDTDIIACYKFEPKSKRIYGKGIEVKKYSWEDKLENRNFILDMQFEEVSREDCPF